MSRGTPLRCIRVEESLWLRFDEIAKANGTTRTELIREWIRVYVETAGKRPDPDSLGHKGSESR